MSVPLEVSLCVTCAHVVRKSIHCITALKALCDPSLDTLQFRHQLFPNPLLIPLPLLTAHIRTRLRNPTITEILPVRLNP